MFFCIIRLFVLKQAYMYMHLYIKFFLPRDASKFKILMMNKIDQTLSWLLFTPQLRRVNGQTLLDIDSYQISYRQKARQVETSG